MNDSVMVYRTQVRDEASPSRTARPKSPRTPLALPKQGSKIRQWNDNLFRRHNPWGHLMLLEM